MKQRTLIKRIMPWVVLGLVVFLIWALGDSRMPLLFAALLSYLCHPLVRALENRGLRRSVATILVFIGIVSPVIIFLVAAVPALSKAISEFIVSFPRHAEQVLDQLDKFAGRFGYSVPVQRDEIVTFITEKVQLLSIDFLKDLTTALKTSVLSLSSGILFFLNLVLIPVFFFYVMNDLEIWKTRFRSVIPVSARPQARMYIGRINEIFGHYLRGQTLDCLVLGLMYGTALQLVGLPFGWLIGGLTGFFTFIPYLGFGIGFFVALVTALAAGQGTSLVLWVLVVMGIIQFLESFVITPRLVGHKVGLSPLDAILALIICGNLFGFVGLLIAIPSGALFKEVLREMRRNEVD